MATPVVILTAPPYSFLQPAPPVTGQCGLPEADLCLPVYSPADLAFQLNINLTFASAADLAAFLEPVNFGGHTYTPLTMAAVYTGQTFALNTDPTAIFEFTGTDENYTLQTATTLNYTAYFTANGNIANWEALVNGTCFNIYIYKAIPYVYHPLPLFGTPPPARLNWQIVNLGALSNCFVKNEQFCDTPPCNVPQPPATCAVPVPYTSLLRYRNNSDAFGFAYDIAPASYYSSVRLPFYLHSPVYTEEQMTYQLSDGSSQKLSHRIWKDYKFKTDYWYDDWVQKFVVATAHDQVLISNPYAALTNESFVRTEKIDTEWYQEETPIILRGISKGVLRIAAPLTFINSNCK